MSVITKNSDTIHERDSYEIQGKVAEMGALTSDVGADIPISSEKLEKIKSKDSDPKFVVVEIEQCLSGSKNEWPGEIITSIAEQVNRKKPVGYRGHIPDSEDHTAFPPVHAVWLGAVANTVAGKVVARVKGYILPKSELREEIEFEAVDGVSVRGDCSKARRKEGGWRVTRFDLESIDFARKGRAGMPARIVAVTSEMESEGGNSVEPKDIAALDESELRAHNSLLVKKIEEDAVKPLQTKVSEMEATAAVVKPKVDLLDEICQKLGIEENEDPLKRIADLLSKVEGAAKERVKGIVNKAISKLAGKDEQTEKLVHRLISEQIHNEFEDSDLGDDDLEKEIDKKVKEFAENDETVKSVISEMRVSRSDRAGGAHPGGHSRETNEEERRSKSGGVKFSTRKMGVH